jgi:hypothetical protein
LPPDKALATPLVLDDDDGAQGVWVDILLSLVDGGCEKPSKCI